MSGVEVITLVVAVVAVGCASASLLVLHRTRRDLITAHADIAEIRVRLTAPTPSIASEPEAKPAPDPQPQPHRGRAARVPALRVVPTQTRHGDAIRTSDGDLLIVPSTEQVVRATLGQPLVRLASFSHGLRRALLPANRDRVGSLVRRDFQRRRKIRQRVGRQAARMAPMQHDVPRAESAQPWVSNGIWPGRAGSDEIEESQQ
ncbi:MAG: hypothetical protein ACRDP1_05560 [Nocardioidaceae bacterium]